MVDPNQLFNEPYYGIYLTLRSYTAVLDGSAVSEPLFATYLAFRPLVPIPLGKTALFLRPSVSLVRAPIAEPQLGDDYAYGLADTALFTAWVPSPAEDLLWGVGPTFIFPTATHDQLGSHHFQVGPGGGAYVFPGAWVFGLIAQQWWSIGGDSPATSRFDLQYQVMRSLADGWQIGTTPDIFIDWKAEDGEKVTCRSVSASTRSCPSRACRSRSVARSSTRWFAQASSVRRGCSVSRSRRCGCFVKSSRTSEVQRVESGSTQSPRSSGFETLQEMGLATRARESAPCH